MIDFMIRVNSKQLQATYSETDSLLNNILLSIHVRKGTLFSYPEFGSELHKVKRLNDINITHARSYALSALKWVVDTGRAKDIHVDVTSTKSSLAIVVDVTKNDGEKTTYITYFRIL